jgi:type IV secretory pathway VirB10-like protein
MDFGLREGIVVFCGLAVIYLVYTVYALFRVKRRKAAHTTKPTEMVAPTIVEPPKAEEAEEEAEDALPSVYARPRVVPPPTPPGETIDFGAQLLRTQYEQEIRQLRDELATLRDEVAELKAARLVSPQYSEAMAMAQRGLTAQDVADRCGISLGEAELVRALARGPATFEDEDDYGGDTRRLHSA